MKFQFNFNDSEFLTCNFIATIRNDKDKRWRESSAKQIYNETENK